MVRAQAHAPSHLLHRICSVLESVAMSRIGLPKRRIRSAFNLLPHQRRKTHVASSQRMASQLHLALAGEGGILCGLRVRLSGSSVSPSVLTNCSTSRAGHPIATRLGAG